VQLHANPIRRVGTLLKYLLLLVLAVELAFAADPSTDALAKEAQKAQNSGQIVRAYLLYAEAAARDPQNEAYRTNRDGLRPLAKLLSKAGIEKEPTHDELLSSVPPEVDEPLRPVDRLEKLRIKKIQPRPRFSAAPGFRNFHTQADERGIFETVARAYGVKVIFDPQFDPEPKVALDVDHVDFGGAMAALTQETNTFVFAITSNTIFVARDTTQKRDEYEPQVAVTVPLPDITDEKGTTEAANAARQAFELKHIGLDSAIHSIVIRDRVSRAIPARAMLESLIHPKSQIAVEVQIITLDKQSNMHYGFSLPNLFPLVNLTNLAQNLTSSPTGFVNFLAFGGGRTLFGLGVTDAQAFASSSQSWTQNIFDATVVVSSGEVANFHVGDKYPIATSLYSGASQAFGSAALYNPPPQTQTVDLGVVLKLKPILYGDGDISLEIEALYSALGSITINTVPEILQREFKGTVRLRSSQWAVLAGLDTQSSTSTRTGFAGLSQVPVIRDLFSDVNRTHNNSQTLVLLKPRPTRDEVVLEGRSYFVGGQSGNKVLL
jgi:general secretion pathway protein D